MNKLLVAAGEPPVPEDAAARFAYLSARTAGG